MGRCVQVLAVCCPLLLLAAGMLEAQQKTELIVGVMAVEVDVGTTHLKPVTVTSDEAARVLSALLSDTTTRLIGRSQVRVSDGMTSMLKFGNHQSFADSVCASPLTNHFGTGAALEIIRHFHPSQEFTLHVVVSQEVKLGCLAEPMIGPSKIGPIRNEFDLKLHDGEAAILGGLSALSKGDVNSQLLIALIPRALHIPDAAN
jgi:hypothetical protein